MIEGVQGNNQISGQGASSIPLKEQTPYLANGIYYLCLLWVHFAVLMFHVTVHPKGNNYINGALQDSVSDVKG